MTNSRPAFRKDDTGIHAACCNTNTWKAVQGSGTVFINNKEAVRLGDQTKHCGGSGNMIEGSDNVMIGGASAGGGGGGSGGGSSSTQGGGGTSSGSGSQSGINSNQTGSGGGGGGGGAAGGTTRGGGGGGGGGAAGTSSSSNQQENEKKEDKDVFTLWLELAAVNGGKLIGEIVDIIDPDTKEVVATAEVGEDGKVFAEVPKNKPYHVDVRSEHEYHFHHEPPNENLLSNQLVLNLFDEDGLPLLSGFDVKIKGEGIEMTTKTEHGGHVSADVPPGTYEITILGQTFVADSLSGPELDHPDAHPYEFQVDTEDKQ